MLAYICTDGKVKPAYFILTHRKAVAIARVLAVLKEKQLGVEDALVKQKTKSAQLSIGVVRPKNSVKIRLVYLKICTIICFLRKS